MRRIVRIVLQSMQVHPTNGTSWNMRGQRGVWYVNLMSVHLSRSLVALLHSRLAGLTEIQRRRKPASSSAANAPPQRL